MDGIYLRRNRGGEYENVAILVAIAVYENGYRKVLGAEDGMKEDKISCSNLRDRSVRQYRHPYIAGSKRMDAATAGGDLRSNIFRMPFIIIVRSERQIVKKAVYIAIGINMTGMKEVLGVRGERTKVRNIGCQS